MAALGGEVFRSTRQNPTFTYRMTAEEYKRYLIERDAMRGGMSWPADANAAPLIADLVTVKSAGGRWVTDGTHGTACYDGGFFWARTTQRVGWL